MLVICISPRTRVLNMHLICFPSCSARLMCWNKCSYGCESRSSYESLRASTVWGNQLPMVTLSYQWSQTQLPMLTLSYQWLRSATEEAPMAQLPMVTSSATNAHAQLPMVTLGYRGSSHGSATNGHAQLLMATGDIHPSKHCLGNLGGPPVHAP